MADYTFSFYITTLLFACVSCPICQRSLPTAKAGERNSRSRTCFGCGPGYPYSCYIYRFIEQNCRQGFKEDRCLPFLISSVKVSCFFSLSIASSSQVLLNLYLGRIKRCSFDYLDLSFASVEPQAPERRCSSRTFRYGYLVTT